MRPRPLCERGASPGGARPHDPSRAAAGSACIFGNRCPQRETDVGIDLGTPVVEAIGCEHESEFTGRIPKVTIEVK